MSYTYALLIDENRFVGDMKLPEEDGVCWHVARTIGEAKGIIHRRGMPRHIALSQNIGFNSKTGEQNHQIFMKWLHFEYWEKGMFIPNVRFHDINNK